MIYDPLRGEWRLSQRFGGELFHGGEEGVGAPFPFSRKGEGAPGRLVLLARTSRHAARLSANTRPSGSRKVTARSKT